MHGSYWERTLRARIGRRRAIGGTLTLAGAAALLAACGGDDGTGSAGKTAAGVEFAKQVDTTSKAQPGGIYQGFATFETTTLDVLATSSFTAQVFAGYCYSRLLKFKAGVIERATGELEGDLAESSELADDGLQLTFRLRPNAALDPRPPTSGRAVTAADVALSWEKFSKVSVNRTDMLNSVNPDAPVLSLTTPDTRTVVVKLAFPYAPILALFGSQAHLWVMPKEAEGGFDPKIEARGSGPWMSTRYDRSSRYEWRKNPNYYVKNRPFMDGIDNPILTETAQQEAQFRAKNVWSGGVAPENIVTTKKDLPELLLLQGGVSDVRVDSIGPGFKAAGSPFRDERVRQALSMLIDRDAYVDVATGRDIFVKQGLPVEAKWHSHLGAGWGPFYLDPKSKEFGANAKYFQRDVAEAKKLLSAAGFANGLETDAFYIPTAEYGVNFGRNAEIILQMFADGGVRAKTKLVDYRTEFLPNLHFAKGQTDGLTFYPHGPHSEPGIWMFLFYSSKGGRTHVAEGINPELDRLINAQLKELDSTKRIALIHDIQRLMAKTMEIIPQGGDIAGLSLTWPWVGNAGVYRGWPGSTYTGATDVTIHTWIDKSKMKT